jgi:cell division protein FtsB
VKKMSSNGEGRYLPGSAHDGWNGVSSHSHLVLRLRREFFELRSQLELALAWGADLALAFAASQRTLAYTRASYDADVERLRTEVERLRAEADGAITLTDEQMAAIKALLRRVLLRVRLGAERGLPEVQAWIAVGCPLAEEVSK